MGIVALRGIEIHGKIGVTEMERNVGRKFLVDIEVKVPMQKAGVSDSIHDILNYATLSEIIHAQLKNEFHLIEAAARAIGEQVVSTFPDVKEMNITIWKMNPFMQGSISAAGISWRYPEDW
jgi:dihydroneopterin aldolase